MKNTKCKVCEYLDGFHNKTIKGYLNSKIFNNIRYVDFIGECYSMKYQNTCIKKTNDIERILTIHYFTKHKSKCLKDFIPITERENETTVKNALMHSLPDNFINKSKSEQCQYFQEKYIQILYMQVEVAANLHYELNKDQIELIEMLHNLAFKRGDDINDR